SHHGGYYALGLRRNVHPGVHLLPQPLPPPAPPATNESGEASSSSGAPDGAPSGGAPPPRPRPLRPAPVQAIAPGYIVAARLCTLEAKGHQLLGNHLGFVLVRHEFRAAS